MAVGLDVELHNHAAGSHGFDVMDPSAMSREIITRSVEFMKSRLSSSAVAARANGLDFEPWT